MTQEELNRLNDETIGDLYNRMLKENDPEKLGQIAEALSKITRANVESAKANNEAFKYQSDDELARLKREDELERSAVDDKYKKAERRRGIAELVLGAIAVGGALFIQHSTKKEETDSYLKTPKSDGMAKQICDKFAFKKR